MRVSLFCLIFFALLASSCKKYSATKGTFFIQPNIISVLPTIKQGSSNHKIIDLWVYVNGQFSGVYPTENLIPIMSNGKKVSLNIYAGVKNNGNSQTRLFWPMYEKLDIDTLVEVGKTITRNFTFKYAETTSFVWQANFDNFNQRMERSSNSIDSTVSMKTVADAESIEQNYLELKIKGTGDYAQIESTEKFEVPVSNSNVYLEINYKNNNPFNLALIADNGEIKDVFTFNAQSNWNKTYVYLADVVNQSPLSVKYKLCFYAVKTIAEEPKILLDNLKIVYK